VRSTDHIVISFASLAAARACLEALGFLVAPEAVHPFGTGNACVFFADGSYLEPLAVVDNAAYARAIADGNLFVGRDTAFRHAGDLPAFSGLALRSSDALGDRAVLAEHGVGEEGVVDFSRSFIAADGEETALSFRLTFARSPADFDATLFFCQKLHSTVTDRSALTRHPNGATGLSRIVLVGDASPAARLLLESATGEPLLSDAPDTHRLALAGTSLEIIPDDLAAERYGYRRGERGGLVAAGIVLSVSDLARTRSLLGPAGSTHRPDRVAVGLDAAGSAFIAFEESPS
jgi:hypothetical protein